MLDIMSKFWLPHCCNDVIDFIKKLFKTLYKDLIIYEFNALDVDQVNTFVNDVNLIVEKIELI